MMLFLVVSFIISSELLIIWLCSRCDPLSLHIHCNKVESDSQGSTKLHPSICELQLRFCERTRRDSHPRNEFLVMLPEVSRMSGDNRFGIQIDEPNN
ncbi:hypothetical protein GALMADRAFT_1111729 [Galerina marginata CBS 339.88]|uniref:Secreted protein n=1 Tax=Galerina marginata (strain CBS 339.88) TaxID=685588 RepID=A0A067TPF9_GALM3|nr:hypothetical protein GALMADRAFT_1111729 [Galerina marginata CBS 339.88]